VRLEKEERGFEVLKVYRENLNFIDLIEPKE
jgi:hypothetical protein